MISSEIRYSEEENHLLTHIISIVLILLSGLAAAAESLLLSGTILKEENFIVITFWVFLFAATLTLTGMTDTNCHSSL